jgi:hypothetical protein
VSLRLPFTEGKEGASRSPAFLLNNRVLCSTAIVLIWVYTLAMSIRKAGQLDRQGPYRKSS